MCAPCCSPIEVLVMSFSLACGPACMTSAILAPLNMSSGHHINLCMTLPPGAPDQNASNSSGSHITFVRLVCIAETL